MNVRPVLAVGASLVAVAGCGGGTREGEGSLALAVAVGRFPAQQRVGTPARLRLDVRNDDSREAPGVAVTIDSFAGPAAAAGAGGASGPIWIVDRGPGGGTAGSAQTWASGPLAPGAARTFAWAVTPVRPGTYTVDYRISAGAGATVAGGRGSTGSFRVTIRSTAADTRVDPRTGAVVGRPRPG